MLVADPARAGPAPVGALWLAFDELSHGGGATEVMYGLQVCLH